MIILRDTDTLKIELGSAKTANDMSVLVCYRDVDSTDYLPDRQVSTSDGTTPTDILDSPATGFKRIVDFINIVNSDTKSNSVVISFNDGSTDTESWKGVLAQDEILSYVEGAGWIVTNSFSSIGYAVNVQALTSSPVDAQTVYFGTLPKAPVTAANTSKVYIRKAGRIKIAEINCFSGTAGTAEAWSLYVRVNNTTDYLIQTISASASERIFSNTSLDIPVSVGDYIEIKGVQPTWSVNPLTTIYGGYIYIE